MTLTTNPGKKAFTCTLIELNAESLVNTIGGTKDAKNNWEPPENWEATGVMDVVADSGETLRFYNAKVTGSDGGLPMKPNFELESLAERVMSDAGISLPLRLPGGRHIRWVMRIPTLESRCRMARMYLKLGVTHEELRAYTFEQKLEFMVKHTRTVSRMVAYAIVRGRVSGRLLNRPVAWMLRSCMHPSALEDAWMIALSTMSTIPFGNIIRLAEVMSLTAPNLSQRKQNGS